MQSIAIYHSKGGVGKTTTAVNLSYLASLEAPTLICDLDPQASATFYFRVKPKFKTGVAGFVKGGKNVWKNIKATDFQGLDLLPADFRFRSMDLELEDSPKTQKRLPKILSELSDEYRFIFLDCPPNLSNVSENIFRGADVVLVPIIPTTLSLRSYEQVRRFVKKEGFDPGKLLIFFSMFEKRKKLHRDIVDRVVAENKNVLQTAIPFRSDIEKMGINRAPVPTFATRSPAANAYRKLWKELSQHLSDRK